MIIGFGWASCFAQPTFSDSTGLIPRPVSVRLRSGTFTLAQQTRLLADKSVPVATLIMARQLLGFSLPTTSSTPTASALRLRIDSTTIPKPEGYRLTIRPTGIDLIGHDDTGLFFGLQSLRQLLELSPSGRIRCQQIDDYPRFPYRGMQLDVSRHLFPVSFIRKYIDLLARYKLNTFHWHLTDDQGWRVEIKRYPQLQQTAAYRAQTLIGHKKELPHRFDGKRYGGFYSQDEVRAIVRYAADRHITVIPEIEMPGHALAALSAFPQLGCQKPDGSPGGPYAAATFWGIFDDVFCAGNDSTFTMLTNVLDEVIGLFPSRYIHIGGDECPKVRWQTCPRCQARIRSEKLTNENELQRYFIRRIEKHLNRRGRQLIGWDEILEGHNPNLRLSDSAAVMSWRGIEGGIQAMRQHHYAIMTPESHVYFDYYQSLHPDEPLAAAGYTPLRKTYSYEPMPDSLRADEARYLLGVQGNVWTEYMPTPDKAEYMVFPRLLALAETGWTPRPQRNYPDFLRRLRQQRPLLDRQHVHYDPHVDEPTDTVSVSPAGQVLYALTTTRPGAQLRYTTDGSAPTSHSLLYTQPIAVTQSSTIRSALFIDGRQQDRVVSQAFTISKATGKSVTVDPLPSGAYRPASMQVLVNGRAGTTRYNTGEWVGFSGTDPTITVDLDSLQTISQVSTHILAYRWQRMWPPKQLRVSVSTDGNTYRTVYEQTQFPVNGINPVDGRFTPTQARFVRIQATGQGTIPAGEYGAGGKAWLLLDEVIVR